MQDKKWFEKHLKTIMEHNDYESTQITVEECNKINSWTPVDLILREYLNNGGGSAQGFLGVSPKTCVNLYNYIKEHKVEFIDANMINKDAKNNWGFQLWKDYNF